MTYFSCIYLCQFTSHLNLSVNITFLYIYKRFTSYFISRYFLFREFCSFASWPIKSTCFFNSLFSFFKYYSYSCIFLFMSLSGYIPNARSIASSLRLLLKLFYSSSKLPLKFIEGPSFPVSVWTGAFDEVRAAGIGVVGTEAFKNYRSSSSKTFKYSLSSFYFSLFFYFLCSGLISGVVGAWN